MEKSWASTLWRKKKSSQDNLPTVFILWCETDDNTRLPGYIVLQIHIVVCQHSLLTRLPEWQVRVFIPDEPKPLIDQNHLYIHISFVRQTPLYSHTKVCWNTVKLKLNSFKIAQMLWTIWLEWHEKQTSSRSIQTTVT